jgi:hypothetical protein
VEVAARTVLDAVAVTPVPAPNAVAASNSDVNGAMNRLPGMNATVLTSSPF